MCAPLQHAEDPLDMSLRQGVIVRYLACLEFIHPQENLKKMEKFLWNRSRAFSVDDKATRSGVCRKS
jgi:hypothetical protein